MTRRGRRRIVFVPPHDATLRHASITVTCGKLLARTAASLRPGQSLPADAEADLFAHYDMPYTQHQHTRSRRLIPYT